jgi:hypothetical protein
MNLNVFLKSQKFNKKNNLEKIKKYQEKISRRKKTLLKHC